MKVSFDFDSTLSRLDVQTFAKKLVNDGHEVWLVTSRFSDDVLKEKWPNTKLNNVELFKIAEECGIIKEHIIFTNMSSKINFLKGQNFSFHLDDDDVELDDIIDSGDYCQAIDVCFPNWEDVCLSVLYIN